ncbi:MAG: hypothetical protein PVJ05_06585 [Candidatus Thorarchaeota archaeon]
MKRSLMILLFVSCLIFSNPIFVSASTNYEWVIQTGTRYDYSWTVEDNTCHWSCRDLEFQENIYVTIDELAVIPGDIDPADIWSLSETGFNISVFWSNGTEFDVSEVPQPFGFNLLPVGNWSLLIDASPIDAGFSNDDTIFAYEIYDIVDGDGYHKEVKFQKSNGVLELYHLYRFVNNTPVTRLDIELISSSPELIPTLPTSPNSRTPIPPTNLIIIIAGGSVAVLAIAIFGFRKRV